MLGSDQLNNVVLGNAQEHFDGIFGTALFDNI